MPGSGRRRGRLVALAVAVMLVALAASVAVEPERSGASPSTGINWQPCPVEEFGDEVAASMQCANITVPVDYHRPHGRTMSIRVSRRPATQSPSLGPLFVNPGGPGVSAIAFRELVRGEGVPLRAAGPRLRAVRPDRSRPTRCRRVHTAGLPRTPHTAPARRVGAPRTRDPLGARVQDVRRRVRQRSERSLLRHEQRGAGHGSCARAARRRSHHVHRHVVRHRARHRVPRPLPRPRARRRARRCGRPERGLHQLRHRPYPGPAARLRPLSRGTASEMAARGPRGEIRRPPGGSCSPTWTTTRSRSPTERSATVTTSRRTPSRCTPASSPTSTNNSTRSSPAAIRPSSSRSPTTILCPSSRRTASTTRSPTTTTRWRSSKMRSVDARHALRHRCSHSAARGPAPTIESWCVA